MRPQSGGIVIISRVYSKAIRWEKVEEFPLGLRDGISGAKQFDMRDAHTGNDPDAGRPDLGETQYLAGSAHPHLQHQCGVLGLQLKYRLRDTDLIVKVGSAFKDGEVRLQYLRDHLFSRRLTDTARYPYNRSGKSIADIAGDIAEGMKRVHYLDMRQT